MSDKDTTQESRAAPQPPPPAACVPPRAVDKEHNPNTNQECERSQFQGAKVLFRGFKVLEITNLIFAGVLALVGLQQCSIMNRQLGQMEQQSNQTDEALRQSKIALEATISSAHLDQRAWVGTKGMEISPLEPGKKVSVTTGITNSGKTIALNVTCPSFIMLSREEMGYEGALKYLGAALDDPATRHPSAIFPNQDSRVPISTRDPVTAAEIAQIVSGQVAVFVGGDIYYTDVFGVKHRTSYFGRYNPELNRIQEEQTHNSAD